MQCNERVDLLEALRKSRQEVDKKGKKEADKPNLASTSQSRPPVPPKPLNATSPTIIPGAIGDGTVPPVPYPEISRAPPPLPVRPPLTKNDSNSPTERSYSSSQINNIAPPPPSYTPPTLPVPVKKTSRTPSPEKKGGRIMLTTLRGPKDAKGKPAKAQRLNASRVTPPASSIAAGLAWDSKSHSLGQKPNSGVAGNSGNSLDSQKRGSIGGQASPRPESANINDIEDQALGGNSLVQPRTRTPPDLIAANDPLGPSSFEVAQRTSAKPMANGNASLNVPPNVEQKEVD